MHSQKHLLSIYCVLLCGFSILSACSDAEAPAIPVAPVAGSMMVDLNTPVDPNNTMMPITCSSDQSCGDGFVCVDSVCRPGVCNLDKTCPAGQTCGQR